jgi:transposase
MKRFIEGEARRQATLLPESQEGYVKEDNPVRVVDVFIDELDLEALGFSGVVPEVTGRPAYHPATLLKIYLYGYLNCIQSSRRLERETQRNIEHMWLPLARSTSKYRAAPALAGKAIDLGNAA